MKKKLVLLLLPLSLAALLIGCSELAYYGQAIEGQWLLLAQRKPLKDTLADPNLNPRLRQRLEIARELRRFASRELHLPDNGSYRSYVDLGRPYVVRNVFAAPELSLRLESWCFPMIGCVNYRGYFDHQAAEDFAAALRKQGKDVFIGNVPAFSTLGWFDDPLLNTFMHWTSGRLAELIFHELSHQRLYIADDTTFNESFATAVGRLGVERWLAERPEERMSYQDYLRRRQDFLDIVLVARKHLYKLYTSARSETVKRAGKQRILAELRECYANMKRERWGGYSGYDRWFAQDLNNAKLGALSSYNRYVPAFKGLFRQVGEDFRAFYREVEALGALPKAQRKKRLRAFLPADQARASASARATCSAWRPAPSAT